MAVLTDRGEVSGDRKRSASLSVQERVFLALERSPYVPKRFVRLETEPGRIRIHGTVRTYFQKQMAQEVVRKVAEGLQVVNDLTVIDRSTS